MDESTVDITVGGNEEAFIQEWGDDIHVHPSSLYEPTSSNQPHASNPSRSKEPEDTPLPHMDPQQESQALFSFMVETTPMSQLTQEPHCSVNSAVNSVQPATSVVVPTFVKDGKTKVSLKNLKKSGRQHGNGH
ncbi:hypothetical protein OROMI_000894 [Orobanche minor]